MGSLESERRHVRMNRRSSLPCTLTATLQDSAPFHAYPACVRGTRGRPGAAGRGARGPFSIVPIAV